MTSDSCCCAYIRNLEHLDSLQKIFTKLKTTILFLKTSFKRCNNLSIGITSLGLGYIKKVSRSKIIWKNKEILNIPTNEEISEKLQLEIRSLEKEEASVQNWNKGLMSELKNLMNDNYFKQFGYFTYNQIKELTKMENVNLIAINAPNGTMIEEPDSHNIEKLYEETLKVI